MAATIYYASDADPDIIAGRRVAVIGYGSQGHAHALNLRDSGVDVRVGLRTGSGSRAKAEAAGLPVTSIAEAAADADVVMVLAPDTDQQTIFEESIAPHLEPGNVLLFAHGFNIRFGLITPPAGVDVAMVAPKGPGHLVRRTYEGGGGVPALIAVEQDATGTAKALALSYADAIGATRAGVLETTFAEETETDLFGEQVVLCGGLSALIQAGFETLVEAGYEPESAYFECLHEVKLIVDLMYEHGISGMRYSISTTAEYGDLTRGPRIVNDSVRAEMRQILEEIRSGKFAEEWIAEFKSGSKEFTRLEAEGEAHPIEKVGAELRGMMPFINAGSDRPQDVSGAETPRTAGPAPADAEEIETDGDDEASVLADLRKARRRRRTAEFDVFEAIYRAYITGVVSAVAIWLLSGVVGDSRVGPATAAHVTAHGAQVVGLVVGVVLAVGCRSGGRGGPLVIEAADVRHVLLSPVDRTVALRPQAYRQIRFGTAVGAAVGAVAGLLAYRRLPGDPVAWVAAGAATLALAVLGSFGLALIVSGRRLGARLGSLLAVLVVGWSVGDLVAGTTTSPATWLGEVALWPLRFRPLGLAGMVVPLAAVVVGLAVVGGASIEAAERRATLVGQIRFAATLQDLRTVVVLRRQLAQEMPRQRPWIRLPRSLPAPGGPVRAGRRQRWFPVWRRGWHGILRFPALRLARLAVLGAVAGVSLVGVWRGTTPLILVAALALYVAALDAVEPLSQELDHPDRTDSYGIEEGVLMLRNLGPSVVVMVVVALIGWGTAVAVTLGSGLAVDVGGLMVLPAALCAVGAACTSVVAGPPPVFSASSNMLPPEMAGIRSLVRALVPPLVALAGVLPVLAGHSPPAGSSAAAATGAVLPFVVILAAAVAGWIRYRVRVAAWWRNAMDEASAARQPGGFKGPPARS